jgi:hypothetical protein
MPANRRYVNSIRRNAAPGGIDPDDQVVAPDDQVVARYQGLPFSRARDTLSHMTTPSRRQWTDETIREELLPISEELGRMPKKSELTERGIGALWAAMGRRGGVDSWREVVAAHLATPTITVETTTIATTTVVAVSDEQIAIAAYFMFQNGHPGGPESHWAAAERQLATA